VLFAEAAVVLVSLELARLLFILKFLTVPALAPWADVTIYF
jgi:hypothetical protein